MTDYDLVEKSWEIAQSFGWSRIKAAKHIGVSETAYGRWINRQSTMRRSSVEKIKRFIERVDSGETFEPKPEPDMNRVPLENIHEDVRPVYRLIYKIEDKYGKLEDADEDDPLLKELRKKANGVEQ